MKLTVKNMVCPRCIEAVTKVFTREGINPVSVALGQVETEDELSPEKIDSLHVKLEAAGFEFVEDSRKQLVEKIKAIIIKHIHYNGEKGTVLSEQLSTDLHRDYSGLSKMFSAMEGITIEQYVILQKTERVKELLLYNQLTLSEIAYQMGYSSVAHLSAQFRKSTGITPTEFRRQGASLRKPLDDVSRKV